MLVDARRSICVALFAPGVSARARLGLHSRALAHTGSPASARGSVNEFGPLGLKRQREGAADHRIRGYLRLHGYRSSRRTAPVADWDSAITWTTRVNWCLPRLFLRKVHEADMPVLANLP